ncbi:MAG: tRNA glutamyl-Q(34) synthetase GluQRS [Verrucomicrobiota bacterium]
MAPSPTGYLHVGHARTFWTAWRRAREAGGTLVLRNDDLDAGRARPEFVEAFLEDLAWLGLNWDEGPFAQSGRMTLYEDALRRLKEGGWVYPCQCSRRDVMLALAAPHAGEDEPLYPGTCRGKAIEDPELRRVSWRMRVAAGAVVEFEDGAQGRQRFVAGSDFGDFVVWRPDGLPSYQLACMVDDAGMGMTEVVRGEDLLASTARQLLLYRALGCKEPRFHHCPLVRDSQGRRLAKRHDALSVRELRRAGLSAADILHGVAGGLRTQAP